MPVPLCELTQQYLALKDEIDTAMQEVAANAQYILGPNVKALEAEIAEFCQCQHAVGVGSGTDALHLALRALNVGPGDEVITTPFTFVATTEAIGIVGATPVFVDIDPQTYNLAPNLIEPAITPRTKAILPVHLYGQPCDMDAIMEIARRRGLFVVEDCAQAIGASYRGRRVGSFGDAGCLSFFPSKNLGCFGDGGMVVTNNPETWRRVEMLRRHGGTRKYHHEELGLNSRLDELQAAIVRVKLPHLETWNQRRRECAYRYNRLLSALAHVRRPAELTSRGPVVPDGPGEASDVAHSVYHQYTVTLEQRDLVQKAISGQVTSAIYYPVPLHQQEVHRDLNYPPGSLPHAEYAAAHCLSLPMFPELTLNQQRIVSEALREASPAPSTATYAATA